jgi:2-polyprenyl-3-methyl-5-hydroxy-6-metoxy-1,4-benzoquinol methylase
LPALLCVSQTNFITVSSCPSCESREFQIVGRVAKSFEVSVGQTRFHQPEYRVKKCSSCSLYYKSTILNETELEKYYRSVDFEKWEVERSPPSEQVLLETLRRLGPGSKILDYGCSSGRLLSQLTADYACFGLELNVRAADLAGKKGITILRSLDDGELRKDQFDAIVLSDVFEHLQAPTKALECLVRLLNPRGLLLLVTGNADAAIYQKDIANNWYFR